MHSVADAESQRPRQCSFVLADRRPCKFAPVDGTAFCAHHRLSDPSGAIKRVPCPVDPAQ